MRCHCCEGQRYLTRLRSTWSDASTPFEYETIPCPECHAGEISCCEGSERHGQLGPGDE